MREKRIMFGILFLVHMFYPPLSLRTIMKLWPLVLIALGSEMVAANRNREEGREEILKYDKGAVFLVFLLTCFAAGMGAGNNPTFGELKSPDGLYCPTELLKSF